VLETAANRAKRFACMTVVIVLLEHKVLDCHDTDREHGAVRGGITDNQQVHMVAAKLGAV
jgi:hypothetical protein